MTAAFLHAAAQSEARELVLHELRQPMATVLKAREKGWQVAPYQHRRVAAVGPAGGDARPWTYQHGAHPCTS